MKTKIKFPAGATHVRLTQENKKEITVERKVAQKALEGLDGELTFFVMKGSKLIPIAEKPKKSAKQKAAPQESAGPVAPKPSAKKGKAVGTRKAGKTEFIAALIREQTHTAKEIAKKVVQKFPEQGKNPKTNKPWTPEEEFEKALRFTRAVPWHMKQKGEKAQYRREYEARKTDAAKQESAVAA